MHYRLAATLLLLIFSAPAALAPARRFETAIPQKTLDVLIEGEDPVMVELFGRELQSLAAMIRTSINLIEKETKPYDLRIVLASNAGSKTGSCTGSCSSGSCSDGSSSSCSCSSCSVTITLYFCSAVVLKADGILQSADTGVGITRAEARSSLVKKLISRL